jgi:hypothetical protein
MGVGGVSHLRRWGAIYVLLVLFLGSWAAQLMSEWHVFAQDQADHDQPVDRIEFAWTFAQSTFENWQSEWLQLLGEALLFLGPLSALLWQADQASRDVARLEDKVDVLLARDPSEEPS